MCRQLRRAQKSRQIPNPCTKLVGANTLRVIGGVIKDAEDIFDKKVYNRKCHTSESPHEEVNRVRKIPIKRGASILNCIHPGVDMINPNRVWISEDSEEQENKGKMCCKMSVI
jgi:hypothetical protein